MMQTFNKVGNSSPLLEKIFRILIPAGVIYGGLKLWNFLAPTIIEAAQNTWKFIAIVVPLIALLGWVALNYRTIWMWYLGFCRKLTAAFIKLDPLSIMDGYLVLLRKKWANLEEVRVFLEGKRVKLERLVSERIKSYEENRKMALAAEKQGNREAATRFAFNANTDKSSVDAYQPILAKYNRNNQFLSKLSENWKTSIDTLAYTIERKREEYETLREMYKGLKSAEDFANSDNEAAQAYAMSVKALEEDVSQKIAYIEDFEKRAKPIMTNMDIQKQAKEDEAMKLLEELMKNDTIKLPDYSNFSITNGMGKVATDISYEPVKKYNI